MTFSLGSLGRKVLLAVMLLESSMPSTVHATRAMSRPENYKSPERTFAMEPTPPISTLGSQTFSNLGGVSAARLANGKAQFAYYTNWGTYGANFQPQNIVTGPITHILYSFADTNPTTGNIFLTDPYADEQRHYADDSWNETGNNLYGALKQLYLLKMKQRNLKVLLSIGGWTYSQAGHFDFVTSASARAKFVTDAIKLIEDYGFDGIDIDYEYPTNSAQGQGLADLVTSLRTALTQLQTRKGDSVPYLITAAVGAGPSGFSNLMVKQMDKAMDYWNLMAYDYAGSWLTWVDNQANIYGGTRTGISGDSALNWYIQNGATPSKINLGIPMYGRAFQNTAGLGQPYNGIGPGTIEAGIYSYKTLPLAGSTVFQNKTDITSNSYDAAKREFVSYDTPSIAKMKAIYAVNRGLAGAMFWELSQDKVGAESLVKATSDVFNALDNTPNHLKFPNSKWDNLRNNFAGSPSTTTSGGGGQPTGQPGSCAGTAAYSATKIYVGGDKATYSGNLWTAQWWTQNEAPGGPSGVWVKGIAC